ncbi:hypothetical protein [Gluconobacter potus]|uniref:hypothetical protein n=1 Tax=Gluconobacter potus TaxID=2724927 RepID=UPI0039E81854
MRASSPHEQNETPKEFLDDLENNINKNLRSYGRRWNFLCPLQPNSFNKMPDVIGSVDCFVKRFSPERTRILFLNPDRHSTFMASAVLTAYVDRLRLISSVEVASLDARDREANGLFLADFFDFT